MANYLAVPGDDLINYGPAMQAVTQLQRNFVTVALENPTLSHEAIAKRAGYAPSAPPNSTVWRVEGHRNMHDPRVLAAMDEEANRRLRHGGAIGVAAVVKIAMNESHKDHLKAALALMNRTGRHEMTEHKVVVDDKRPETKQELIAAIKSVAKEAGLDDAAIAKLVGPDVVEAEFEEVDEVDAAIAAQMEDL